MMVGFLGMLAVLPSVSSTTTLIAGVASSSSMLSPSLPAEALRFLPIMEEDAREEEASLCFLSVSPATRDLVFARNASRVRKYPSADSPLVP